MGQVFVLSRDTVPFKTVPVSVYYVQYSAQLSVEILLSARQQRLQQKGMFTPFIKKKNR